MAGRCSPKSKIQFQLSLKRAQATNLPSQLVADSKSDVLHNGDLLNDESVRSEKKNISDKGRLRTMKMLDDDDDDDDDDERSEDVEVSLLRQRFSSQSEEASLDSELWNSLLENQVDGSPMSKSSFPLISSSDLIARQFTTVSEQRQSKRENDGNDVKERKSGTKDEEKYKSGMSSKYGSAFEAGKETSVKRSPAKVHISSEFRGEESAVTMKTLMSEFGDLTKNMSNLKQSLKSQESNSKSFMSKHSGLPSPNEISVITDVYGAKKIILDCIAELSVIKNFLDGNRRESDEDSHFSDQFKRKSVVSTLESETPHLGDTFSKTKSDTVIARTSSTDESLGFNKVTSNSKSKLDTFENNPLNYIGNSKENTAHETSAYVENTNESLIPNSEAQNCASGQKLIDSSVLPEVETTENRQEITRIDEKIVNEDLRANVEHKKSKKRKWYWCFMNCTRSASPKRKDDRSDKDNPTSPRPDEIHQQSSASSKEVDSVLPSKEESEGLRSNVEHPANSSSRVDNPLCLTKNKSNDLSTNSFHRRIFDDQLFRINACYSLSKLVDYKHFPFYYNRHGLDDRNCKVFEKYNARREEMHRDVKSFSKSCTGWTSQPDFSKLFEAPPTMNDFVSVRCTNGNFLFEPRRTKSVDFLLLDKLDNISTISSTKTEEDHEEKRVTTKDVDENYTGKEDVLKDVYQCLQNYLRRQRYPNSKSLKRTSRSKSIKRLAVNSSTNSAASQEVCCALQIICRKKKEGEYQPTLSKLSNVGNDDDIDDEQNERRREIPRADERKRTWTKSNLEDQREHVGESLSVRKKRNSDEVSRRGQELQVKKSEPSTNAYLQNYNNFYVVQNIDTSALKKSLFSEEQAHVLSSETKASAKLLLNNDCTWNSKTFLCSGRSNAPRAPSYYLKRDTENDVTKTRRSIEGMSAHWRKCNDQAKQGMREYTEVEYKPRNNRDICIEHKRECCNLRDELFDKLDRSRMVWALAKVNAFDDGSRTYEIIKTTPLPSGQRVNVNRANVIKVGKTNYCKGTR